MEKGKVIPVCDVEIIDEKKVEAAREKIENIDQVLGMADIFKLLGEPTRLKIILALENSELCVCDLAATIDSTVSAVSHQLRLLRNARLVKYRKAGKLVYYSVEDEHIDKIIEQVKEHIEE
ncbi:MAG: helix-turn-helix transcriptional regulator [Chlorobi bacterium]|nr:helix-turn-helix transcriptional regulator [Chlorobiota bacterium]